MPLRNFFFNLILYGFKFLKVFGFWLSSHISLGKCLQVQGFVHVNIMKYPTMQSTPVSASGYMGYVNSSLFSGGQNFLSLRVPRVLRSESTESTTEYCEYYRVLPDNASSTVFPPCPSDFPQYLPSNWLCRCTLLSTWLHRCSLAVTWR